MGGFRNVSFARVASTCTNSQITVIHESLGATAIALVTMIEIVKFSKTVPSLYAPIVLSQIAQSYPSCLSESLWETLDVGSKVAVI